MSPARIQLSRVKGFRLHEASHALNGLEVRRVDRASRFGNPFRYKQDEGCIIFVVDEEDSQFGAAEQLVSMFRCWALSDPDGMRLMERARQELHGRNLACWCCLDSPCHADVLLEIANA